MDPSAPLLVLGSGHRCGSTLVQRLLNSHPDVLVWGEHYGVLRPVFDAMTDLGHWESGFGGEARNEFDTRGHQGWIAVLLPGDDAVRQATRAYVRSLFAEPAQARGRARWGFKEVRYGAEFVAQFRTLFPATKVVHITRDPRDMLRSLAWWEMRGYWKASQIEESLGSWLKINRGFLQVRSEPWLLSVRYEDVVADPASFTSELAQFTGLDPTALDQSVFETKVHGQGEEGRTPRQLPALRAIDVRLRSLIAEPQFVAVAAEFGYALDVDLGARMRDRGRWAARRMLVRRS